MSVACLVLNASYEPLHAIDAKDGMIHILAGRAKLYQAHPEHKFRTVKDEYPVPVVIVLNRYVPQKRKWRDKAKLNKHALYVRDNYTCGYCGRHVSEFKGKERLTKDHVVPRDLGGKSTWENLVTACSTCNGRKGNRTPEQAGMRLLWEPVRPPQAQLQAKRQRHRNSRIVLDF